MHDRFERVVDLHGRGSQVGTTDNNLTGYTFNYTLLKLDGSEISSAATGGKFTIGTITADNGGTINWSLTATK